MKFSIGFITGVVATIGTIIVAVASFFGGAIAYSQLIPAPKKETIK